MGRKGRILCKQHEDVAQEIRCDFDSLPPLLVVCFVILEHQKSAPDLCRKHTCEQC